MWTYCHLSICHRTGFAGKKRAGGGPLYGNAGGPPRPAYSAMPTENWTRYPPHHFDSLDPRRAREITIEVARPGESLSRSHQNASGGGDPVLTQGLASSSLPVAEAAGALPSPRFSALPVCADAACAEGIRPGGASANVAMSVRMNFMLLRLQGKAQAKEALVVTSDGLAVPHGEN